VRNPGSAGSTVADAAVAGTIRSRRTALARAILDRAMLRSELTVGTELTAQALVDRFAAAVEGQSWAEFFAWVERTCEKHAGAATVVRILSIGVPTIVSTLERTKIARVRVQAQFEPVAERMRRVAEAPRAAHPSVVGSLDEIDVALDRLISRLMNFDAATADHSRAVAMWCARIAKRLQLTTAETTFVTRAGLIHDIGKVTTPQGILNAPYRLAETEMAIMREHAAAGAGMIAAIPLVAHLTPAVRGHHERIDGAGYPDGRAGSEIPLAVRIVSVADSFNAMIGNRPYRSPILPTVALEQLKLHRDTQFDGKVVEAMIDVVEPQR